METVKPPNLGFSCMLATGGGARARAAGPASGVRGLAIRRPVDGFR
eukprot:COSAG02_NODE_7256_length_3094_cov_19.263773_7_plen_46_part_00